jgi:hypothetical protein
VSEFEHTPEGEKLVELRRSLKEDRRHARAEIERLEIWAERLTGKIELVSEQLSELYRDEHDGWYDADA